MRLDGSQPLPASTTWEIWELPGTGHKKALGVRVEHMVSRTLCPIEGVVEEEAREQTRPVCAVPIYQEVRGQELNYKQMSPIQQGLGVTG